MIRDVRATAFRIVWLSLLMLLVIQASPSAHQSHLAPVRRAIARAVDFLAHAQQPDGSFLVYRCQDQALTQCVPGASMVSMQETPDSPVLPSQATAVVLRGLTAIEDPRAASLVERGARWLRAQMDAEGMFGYFRMVTPTTGPNCPGEYLQLHVTAFNRSVLESLEMPLPQILPTLATYQRRDGTFAFLAIPPADAEAIKAGGFAREEFRQRYGPLMQQYEQMMVDLIDAVDPDTNAVIFDYLVQHGQPSMALCAYLVQAAQREQAPATPVYAYGPYQLPYTLSRAYAHGATCLEPAKAILQPRLLQQQRADGAWGSVIDTALAANALMGFGYTGEALDDAIHSLLDQQQPDGSWKRALRGAHRLRPALHVSEELSTGHVLEALGIYLKVRRRAMTL